MIKVNPLGEYKIELKNGWWESTIVRLDEVEDLINDLQRILSSKKASKAVFSSTTSSINESLEELREEMETLKRRVRRLE